MASFVQWPILLRRYDRKLRLCLEYRLENYDRRTFLRLAADVFKNDGCIGRHKSFSFEQISIDFCC